MGWLKNLVMLLPYVERIVDGVVRIIERIKSKKKEGPADKELH